MVKLPINVIQTFADYPTVIVEALGNFFFYFSTNLEKLELKPLVFFFSVPGGLSRENVPQFVLLTFDDAVNTLNQQFYKGMIFKKYFVCL